MKNLTNTINSIGSLFTYISTFNGIGAFSDALKQMGIKLNPKFICEIDKKANNTFYANNKFDINKHIDDIRELYKKVKKGLKLDILIQTPPCQSFSLAGKRKGLESDNGNLFLTAIKLQKKVNANIVVYENVKGLLSHHKGEYTYKGENDSIFTTQSKKGEKTLIKEKLTLIKSVNLSYKSLINKDYKNTIGHTLHTIEKLLLQDNRYNYYWKVINSANQGLPQNRERIFIIGIKKELDNGTFKFPQNRDLDFTVADILEDEKNVPQNYYYKNTAKHPLNKTNQEQRKNKIHTIAKYDETMTYEASRRVYAPYVSPCITCNNNSKFMIDDKIRYLTPTENKRIQGFSEDFKFIGTKTNINRQLGNTVSPGVYKNLFGEIFNVVSIEKEIISTSTPTKSKKVRKSKFISKSNNNINIIKNVCNVPDLNYVITDEKIGNDYIQHLNNGGTITMTINKYKNTTDKKNNIIEKKYIVSIDSLEMKGFRNKTQRRFKIIGSIDKLDKIGKRDVMCVRPGGKTKFEPKIDYALNQMGVKKKKLSVVLDPFFGGGGITLRNIEKLNFERYIVNDLEPLIYKTMLAVKKNYKKVLDIYQEVNQNYFDLVSTELREYIQKIKGKKKTKKIKKTLKRIRDNDRKYRDYYKSIGNKLNNHNNMNIYEVAGLFLMFNNKSTNGILDYYEDKTLDLTNCNSEITLKDKSHMIKHWSFVLNFYNVEIYNKDVFELLNDPTIPKDGLVFSDSPYISVDMDKKIIDYGMDNSIQFQQKLQSSLNKFENVIYCNEHCENLYLLGLDKGFDGVCVFPRNNLLGKEEKENTRVSVEFLGYRSNKTQVETTIFNSVNNTDYQSTTKKSVA